jgi:methionine sulfoxide reductase heme-binding subunit
MLQKISKNLFAKHGIVGVISIVLVYVFWLAHYEWHPDMRLWRTFGDAGYLLLSFTLMIGPLSKLWGSTKFLLLWRREFGIWFAITAITHGILIADGWARWDIVKFFGYEFIPQLDRLARVEPGFGLANLIGFVAFLWIVTLAVTSSDRVIKRLGNSSWKWLHTSSNVIFYLVAIHTAYFLFIHYTESFHRSVPPQSTFVIPFIVMTATVFALQFIAYHKVVKTKNQKLTNE